ncbi:unnamed protein product, partial [Schistosoma rodhaini]|uniref:Very-long-chain (3R)-3-hydroxyacyl-CoA dehydratase n=1 Tax=Schistosoma rodhaini TaxID=6188 RepID=A0AA85FGS4_9TREM
MEILCIERDEHEAQRSCKLKVPVSVIRNNIASTDEYQEKLSGNIQWVSANGVARDNLGVPLIVISWSIAEMIRYSYYVADICRVKLNLLTWLRYSGFLVLYPTGISGEVLLIVSGIKRLRETEQYSFDLPNALNCSLSYWFALAAILITYIP